MKKIKVLSVFGTRPEAVKMCPLLLELKRRPGIDSLCCVTAQHREMLDSVLDYFGCSADFDLNIMQQNQTIGGITVRALKGLETVYSEAKPDLVLVHGDTTTTLAGSLAAFYSKICVGHVEAGLRTWDRNSPYPEEMNRRLTGQLAQLHFAPTRANAENLARENIREGVFVTGNTVIDAVRYTIERGGELTTPELADIDFASRRIVLVTCHRRENYGEPMQNIMLALKRLAGEYEDIEIVYPVHLSPIVQQAARSVLENVPRVRLIPPLDTDEMHRLMDRCYIVLTDSGGIQEEAPALGKPVLVLRRETERPEAVEAGTVKLAGVETERIYSLASELLDDPGTYFAMARAVNPYGDGQAARRIADAIEWKYGLRNEKPDSFGE